MPVDGFGGDWEGGWVSGCIYFCFGVGVVGVGGGRSIHQTYIYTNTLHPQTSLTHHPLHESGEIHRKRQGAIHASQLRHVEEAPQEGFRTFGVGFHWRGRRRVTDLRSHLVLFVCVWGGGARWVGLFCCWFVWLVCGGGYSIGW